MIYNKLFIIHKFLFILISLYAPFMPFAKNFYDILLRYIIAKIFYENLLQRSYTFDNIKIFY